MHEVDTTRTQRLPQALYTRAPCPYPQRLAVVVAAAAARSRWELLARWLGDWLGRRNDDRLGDWLSCRLGDLLGRWLLLEFWLGDLLGRWLGDLLDRWH